MGPHRTMYAVAVERILQNPTHAGKQAMPGGCLHTITIIRSYIASQTFLVQHVRLHTTRLFLLFAASLLGQLAFALSLCFAAITGQISPPVCLQQRQQLLAKPFAAHTLTRADQGAACTLKHMQNLTSCSLPRLTA